MVATIVRTRRRHLIVSSPLTRAQQTAEPIARALLEEKMSAVRSVLPPYDNEPDKDMITIALGDEDSLEVFRGRKDGAVTGAAFSIILTATSLVDFTEPNE